MGLWMEGSDCGDYNNILLMRMRIKHSELHGLRSLIAQELNVYVPDSYRS